MSWKMDKWSEERVSDSRAAYFGVTSDIASENINEVSLILINILLF